MSDASQAIFPLAISVQQVLNDLRLGQVFEETPWTAWGVLLLGIFGGLVAGKLAHTVLRAVGNRFTARGWEARGTAFHDAAAPANLALFTFGLSIGLAPLVLSTALRGFSRQVVTLLYVVALAWFLYNLVDLVAVTLRRFASRTESQLDDQLVPLVRKTLRIFLVIVFALFAAENVFGADITAWLAGLGIAGLAVSLAAQDSIKNLFGSITIFLDRPFAVGERIVFGDYDGTVEEIGFRSTKMRTLTGHLVTVPNSKFVDDTVENVGRRPHIRRLLDVTITYDTPLNKIDRAVDIIKQILADPEIASAFADMEKFPPRVAFNDLNADSLNIRVFYWFYPADYWQFLDHSQKFNLKLMRAFEKEGIEFAFPTRTIYLANDARRQLALRMLEGDGESLQTSPQNRATT